MKKLIYLHPLGLLFLLIVAGFKIALYSHPSLAVIFVVLILIANSCLLGGIIYRYQSMAYQTTATIARLFVTQHCFLFTGGLLNATVVLANGGHMPLAACFFKEETSTLYIPASVSKLSFLGDVLWAGCSIGDIILSLSMIAAIVAGLLLLHWYIKRKRNYARLLEEPEEQFTGISLDSSDTNKIENCRYS
jgi:hypothetical protein